MDIGHIKAIRIGLASPEDIRAWSYGEVKKPETINYRTFRPERDGLFCERIFGPTRDWECSCGRYKRVKNKGVRCERCGVEVTRSRVRRERMGHIDLVAPVVHVWYLKGQPPSPLGLLLDISPRQLEKVIYFTNYIVTEIDRAEIERSLGEIRRVVDQEKEHLEEELARVYQELDTRLKRELEEHGDSWTDAQREERIRYYNHRKEMELRERQTWLAELERAVDNLARLQLYQLLDESSWSGIEQLLMHCSRRLGRDLRGLVRAGQGAEAIRELLRQVDLEKLVRELREEVARTQGARRARVVKRLEIVEAFRNSRARPEWMVLEAIPVLPPELRPMVQLDGGRFATSDLNDLYRRIVNRNNRMRKILEIRAPKSIVNSEKRLLQEAVDALIDNSRRTRPVIGSNGRVLKSLSDLLKGKEGRFRKNLLGKRVDYSGRSVIVVGPHLKLHQCGLPKEMALELFKPFVMHRLILLGYANNIKNAKHAVDRQIPEVWQALETVIREHPVLLNRAPTLHRLGIQAFEPILTEGKAIQLHPLVCHAYNADFDGDQMAVHVPLSYPAQAEARLLMLAIHNLFKPADGSPIVSPLQDIVLGAYYLTMNDPQGESEPRFTFGNREEAQVAFEQHLIRMHEPIRVRLAASDWQVSESPTPLTTTPSSQLTQEWSEVVQTTFGRLIFFGLLPASFKTRLLESDPSGQTLISILNRVYNKKALSELIREVYRIAGHIETVHFLDQLKNAGFYWATQAGITFALTDMEIPAERDEIVRRAEEEARRIDELYERGELTIADKRRLLIKLWQEAYDQVTEAMLRSIARNNPLFIITDSGARGSTKQLAQLVGMRGLMSGLLDIRTASERLIEELPVRHSFREGLTTLEYFVSGYGARRGLASTALLTANAGYLTRRMVDVAQDVIVRVPDCQTTEGIVVARIIREGEEIEPLYQRIRGRTARKQLLNPYTGEKLIEENEIISDDLARAIDSLAAGLERFTQTLRDLSEKEPGELFMPDDGQPLQDPQTGEVLLDAYEPIEPEVLNRLRARREELRQLWHRAGFEWVEHDMVGVPIRSPLTCAARQGICAACYGLDMGTLRPVELGTAVGIIAAQSIGEPGTQLTMRVFHTGGVAGAGEQIAGFRVGGATLQAAAALGELEERGVTERISDLRTDQRRVIQQVAQRLLGKPIESDLSDMPDLSEIETEEKIQRKVREWVRKLAKLMESQNTGINRVEELFEARKPKGEAITVDYEGEVVDIVRSVGRWVVLRATLPVGEQLLGKVSLHEVVSPNTGEILLHELEEIRSTHLNRLMEHEIEEVEVLDAILVGVSGTLEVKVGDRVLPGDRLTPGPLNPHELLRLRGVRGVQEYLIREIQAVYKAQGVDIDDKHIEIILRQMLRKRRVVDPGDTLFLPGQIVDRFVFEDTNAQVVREGGRPAVAEWVLLGTSEAAQQTESFLSAASFQRTVKALTDAAVRGKVDELVGLKENVIIGRLIPAGTGYAKPEIRAEFARPTRAAIREGAPATGKPSPVPETKPIETIGDLAATLQPDDQPDSVTPPQEGETPAKPKRARRKKATDETAGGNNE
ncbi:DNA-directed RNA polymerase subunit beta' [bacterium HR15]|nr:DNA-directed RNA polymerase subunit beta' [bacterium HR15]